MMNQSLSTTDHAAYIRHTLKAEHGWNSRQVSVKARYYSMGSSIDVRIKDASVPLSVVEEIANKAERIDRCEFTGEILSGGNRFVHVAYDYDTLKTMGAKWLPAVTTAAAQIHDNYLIQVEGTPFRIGHDSHGNNFGLWADGGHVSSCYGLDGLAQAIAVKMVA